MCQRVQIQINKYFLALVLSLAISVFLRVPYFQHDFIFVDEAWWANGSKVLHQGGRLYQDVVLDKNPPIFWYCAFLFRLFGVSMKAVHAGALLLVCITSVLVFLIGTRFFSADVGAIATLIYAVASTTYYTPRIIGMNAETLMVVFSTAAVYSYLLGVIHGRWLAFFGAGLLSSFAFLTKPAAITETVLFVFFLILVPGSSVRTRLRSLAILLSGFAFGLGMFLGTLLREGILAGWWEQTVLYGFRYVGRVRFDAFLVKLLRASTAFGVIFTWLCILIWQSRRVKWGDARTYRLAALWLLSAFAGVAVGRRFYANYFIQVMPPMALMGAIGFIHLWRSRRQPGTRLAQWTCCAAFLVSFFWFHSRTLAHYCFYIFPRMHEQVRFWDMCAEDRRTREIAEHLKSRTSAEDRIFVWGSKAQLYFLADRPMATTCMDYDVADDFPPRAADLSVQEETAALLRKNLPRYIVDVQQRARLENFGHFYGLVKEHYGLESQIHGARLYRLRETDSEGTVESKDRPVSPPS